MAGVSLTNKIRPGGMFLTLLACLAATTGEITAQVAQPVNAGAVQGRVVDVAGLSVAHASVTVRNAFTGMARQQLTGDAGQFAFTGVPAGRYFVTASTAELTGDIRIVEIGKGEDSSTELRLQPRTLNQQITVMSGSRIEELQHDSPLNVSAVTREQIRDTAYERVSDILSEVPGVITRRGSTATVGGEQIQGIDSRQVLVLQDGLPIVGARGIKSGAINLNRQDVGKLERVEVVKGAASSLYGSDAIGGVINMITREPSSPFRAGISVSGGSLGAVDGRFDAGALWKRFSFFTDLETHRQNAYGLIPQDSTTVGPEFRREDVMTKLRYTFSPRLVAGFAATAYHNHEFGRNLSELGLTRGTSNDSVQSYALTADVLLTSATTFQSRAYAARYDENSRIDLEGRRVPSFGQANLNERYHRLDATISHQFGSAQLVQGGFEWTQDLYRGANRLVGDNSGQQITANDVWLQHRFQPQRNITFTVGGRYHHHSLFGAYAVPKAGIVVKVSDRITLRGSFGKGFRAPDPGQLFYRFANPASFYQVIGNPTLRPETSASYSAGVQYRADRFRVGLNLYRHNLNQLIDSFSAGTPRTASELITLLDSYGIPSNFNPLLNRLTFIYRNVASAYTQGFELDGDAALTHGLRLQAAYTFLDAVDRGTRLRLPQRHRHQGYVKSEYSVPRWGMLANVRGTFFSQWLLNPGMGSYAYPYQVWDAYASKALPRGLQLFGAVDNLAGSTDRKLRSAKPSFDRPDYGRTVRIGLRYTISRGD